LYRLNTQINELQFKSNQLAAELSGAMQSLAEAGEHHTRELNSTKDIQEKREESIREQHEREL